MQHEARSEAKRLAQRSEATAGGSKPDHSPRARATPAGHHWERERDAQAERITEQLRAAGYGNAMVARRRSSCNLCHRPIAPAEAMARRWRSNEWAHIVCVLAGQLADQHNGGRR